MGDFVKRFTSFDKMMGTSIVKVLYFVGVAGIILGTLGAMFSAIKVMGYSFMGGLGALIMAPVFGLIGIMFWRFMCEIYILFFKISDDVSAIRKNNETSS